MWVIQYPSKLRIYLNLIIHIMQMAFKAKGIMQALEDTRGRHATMGDNIRKTDDRAIIPYHGKEILSKLYQIGGF